ncbi:ATP-binding protein [Corynebacterium sp. AOP40-9SA-29]|uniref:ATP-binding protein n=1 Tax=Corynebacterium sp. AOP40-9SA-29 TaxID=3457677 RepID=UPI0040348F6F
MRFSTKVLLLQLATVVAVVAVCSGIFTWISVERLKSQAMDSAVSIARSVAEDPQVRAAVADVADLADTESDTDPAALVNLAAGIEARTGALFVVVTDADGIRLAHPDPERIGERVSTDHEAALRGEEVTAWETGTLGQSARAKVPVYAPDDSAREVADSEPVGEVSVGFRRASVFDDLPLVLVGVAAAGAAALAIGALASVLMRRRWERLTLGVQPEELVALVRHQSAVLDGVDDGVLSVTPDGAVEVCNEVAARLLGADGLGTGPGTDTTVSLADLGLPAWVVRELTGDETTGARQGARPASLDNVVVGDRVLYIDSHPVTRAGRHLGTVVVVRDRTDLAALTRRLGTVQAMGSTLRVQRHEFANRIHAASGLLDAGRIDDARAFLQDMAERGPVDFPLQGAELLDEPFLQSFLGGKSMEAGERGVGLRVGEDTLVLGQIGGAGSAGAVEDVATVLGNLVDNAVAAALRTESADGERWVEVTAMQDDLALTLMVADSGPGLDAVDPGNTESPAAEPVPDPIHGHGIGLALSREMLRRRGGELWVIDRGGTRPGHGAVFGVRLPGVFGATDGSTTSDEETR